MESYIINIYMDIEKRFNANITYVRKYVMRKKIILWILLHCSNLNYALYIQVLVFLRCDVVCILRFSIDGA